MSAALWLAVIAAAAVCYLTKLAGHHVPRSWVEHPRVARAASLVTVALLAALVAVQTAADGQQVVVDARLAGLAAGVVALLLRAPFVVVVLVAAAVAAGLRALT